MARIIKPPMLCDRLIEACRYEYKTRHLVDGRIMQCDQRISIVAGYMTEEISGLSPFTFIHRDDVRWVMVALRQSEFKFLHKLYGFWWENFSYTFFSVRLWSVLRRIMLSFNVTHRSIHLFKNSWLFGDWLQDAASALVRVREFARFRRRRPSTDKGDEEEVLGNN